MMVKGMMTSLVDSIPAMSSTKMVLEEILETAWLRLKVNAAWSILEDDRRVQRIITWRMDTQRLDEQLLVAAMLKEERLSKCNMEQKKFLSKRMLKDDRVEPMDWLEEEMIEHEYIGGLMEKLELGMYEQLDVGRDEEMKDGTDDCMDDALEHTILDRMMEEWVVEVDGCGEPDRRGHYGGRKCPCVERQIWLEKQPGCQS